jgi:RNA polymerase sigma-70 factor (ECF subfamily)
MLTRSRSVPEAFAGFVEGVRPQMLRFFARRIGDSEQAADLTAQTFARAFERRADFRGVTDEQAYGWIWGIARPCSTPLSGCHATSAT